MDKISLFGPHMSILIFESIDFQTKTKNFISPLHLGMNEYPENNIYHVKFSQKSMKSSQKSMIFIVYHDIFLAQKKTTLIIYESKFWFRQQKSRLNFLWVGWGVFAWLKTSKSKEKIFFGFLVQKVAENFCSKK